ncbi:EsaB/YukD family protein [Pseudobutyrivibrio sp.]|uniref:EsaB/YukD family protein n=1 Tax=Pseudobutyrivibrio sp. TaxID=2014367 RepID=UPI003864097C
MENRIVVEFNDLKNNKSVDIDIPTDITVRELLIGLNQAYGLNVDISNVKQCYLKSENPIVLLRGNKTIKEFGLHDGSKIYYTETETE